MKKLLCILCVVVLVAVSCIALVACNLNTNKEVVTEQTATIIDDNGNNIANTTAMFPKRMIFASAAMPRVTSANTPIASTTLSVSVTPSNATNQKVTWNVAFVNPTSAWANGKTATNYVTVTPTDTNGLTAKVECIAAFGEQIKITVTSQDNPNATANCVLDFVKRLNSVSCNVSAGSKLAFNTTQNLTYTLNYSDGTITGTFTAKSIVLTLDNAVFTACKNAVTSSNFVFSTTSTTTGKITQSNLSTTISMEDCTRWLNYTGGNPGQGREQWQAAFYNYVSQNPNKTHAYIDMEYDYTYQGKAAVSSSVRIPIGFTLSSIAVNVNSITLDSATQVL